MNRQTLGAVRKLKDGEGNYLWMPGIAGNVPNTILGAPYVEMPDMPNIGAGLFPIAVGDWQRAYRVVDRVLISVLRDPFTQSGSGQILFRARKRVGGAVTLGEAIVKVKCST
jgi:HK97 family phage major capsid protein